MARRDSARGQGETFLRKESCGWKRSQSLAGTRLEADPLRIASRAVPLTVRNSDREEWHAERERATRGERGRKKIV